MTKRILSRAAKRADQFIATIADQLNGNATRRRAIKLRLYLAMLAAEQHHIVAARAAQQRRANATRHCSLFHWRIDYLRHAV
ncbi:hypothetical protein ACEUAY_02235 [Aeromonas veronii]|uniref:hypothetical protein n=1 Tax=Aeromonas veronii TaxID=654 RepID=UPI00191CF05D|nr:hypothetical protein [Aeromonas veronii]MBL0492830.1 hypothetical protein [Aeromonas veronii]